MEGKHLRVLASVFRSGSSTSDFYKIVKDSHWDFEADSDQNKHLSRRRFADKSGYKRSRNSQGYIDFSIAQSRLCYKSAEICSDALAKDVVSRSGNRLSENDIGTIIGKSEKIETEMPKAYFKPQSNTIGNDQSFRFFLLNSTGSAISYATNQFFTTTANSSYKKRSLLPLCNISQPGFCSGTAWWFSNLNICNGKLICFQPPKSQIGPFPSRKYEYPFILDENERCTKQGDDGHFQRDLGICIVQNDHAYCRVPAGQAEYQGRLGFPKFPRLKRMATISISIPINFCKEGTPTAGPFCIKSVPSNTILPVVENRPTPPSSRCIPRKMEKLGATVCFSHFFNDRKSSIKGQNGGGRCNSNNTKLASTTLLQSGSGIICKRTSASTSVKQHLSKSLGQVQPIVVNKTLRLVAWKILARACPWKELRQGLQILSQVPGTSFNYESVWRKWVSWCDEREINLHSCHLNFVLDFLAQLFEKKFEYSTINTYRSALSAYHDKVDNQPVGKHPKVCNLMTGVFNRNLLKPRYVFIWDIEQVLTFIRGIPNNTELPDMNINLKLTVLLFLTSTGRCHEICYLNIKFMVKTSSSFKFFFTKVTKSWRKGKPPPCLEFHEYSDDKKLCVVACIYQYLGRSAPWRIQGQNQLLQSHMKPYKDVQGSTIANWVKLVLKMTGIDTALSKARSYRSASTSKVKYRVYLLKTN